MRHGRRNLDAPFQENPPPSQRNSCPVQNGAASTTVGGLVHPCMGYLLILSGNLLFPMPKSDLHTIWVALRFVALVGADRSIAAPEAMTPPEDFLARAEKIIVEREGRITCLTNWIRILESQGCEALVARPRQLLAMIQQNLALSQHNLRLMRKVRRLESESHIFLRFSAADRPHTAECPKHDHWPDEVAERR